MQSPIVLISPAMAIGSRYYAPLVDAFERRGWDARALPRRGFEDDLPRASRRADWSYADEIGDLTDAIRAARGEVADRPVMVLGHSLGGQIAAGQALGSADADDRPDLFVGIGTSTPYFRRYPHAGIPVLAAGAMAWPLTVAFGYLPKPAFGGPGARTLMREWGAWAVTGRPPFRVDGRFDVPTLIIKLQADPYAVSAATDDFVDRFCDPELTTRWTYTAKAAGPNGTTDHVRWVRSPEVVVDRIVDFWAQASAKASIGGQVQARFRSP
ncbi:serine aminopeptidase domain-containing protein [Aeromicrobium sp. Leaf350]|uniref:serine aminopeptidase domain-containing protein n=1 Tax=Aeromicrobium sp. Leaf350 TaxID=2876565 RepID=UPI001E2E2FD4|nr:alpha/beta hydrolase [Aeromicrobium sp. Leaf350]